MNGSPQAARLGSIMVSERLIHGPMVGRRPLAQIWKRCGRLLPAKPETDARASRIQMWLTGELAMAAPGEQRRSVSAR
jgi:hypothetical protein